MQRVFHSIRFKVNKVGVQRYSFFYAPMSSTILFLYTKIISVGSILASKKYPLLQSFLYLYFHAVKRKQATFRKSRVGLIIESHVMGDMDDKGPARVQPLSHGNRVGYQLMAVMGLFPSESIDDQCVDTLGFFHLRRHR